MYLSFFGFKQEPFSFAPDPLFLYPSPSHSEALFSMNSVIKERLGTITVTGDVGTGKTTLIYTLLANLDRSIKTAFIFNPKLSFEDLLKYVLRELDAPIIETELYGLLQVFNLYLRERLPADETVAIIIDEAQNMDMEVLEGVNRLSKRESPASKLLQIILVGQPELEKNLDSPGLREFKKRVAIRRQISPLSRAETKSYIDHRLKVAGSASSDVFTPEAIELISKNAAGIPRVINQICDHALLTGYSRSIRKIDAKLIKSVIKEISPIISPNKPRALPRIKFFNLLVIFSVIVAFGLGFLSLLDRYRNQGKNREVQHDPKPSAPFAGEKAQEIGKTPPLKGKAPAPPVVEIVKQAIDKTPPLKGKAPAPPVFEIVKVKEGWSLSFLAQQYYQSLDLFFLDVLMEANPKISNANMIHIGDDIKIPRITEETFLIPASRGGYRIHLGTFKNPGFLSNFEKEPALRGKKFQVIPRKASPQETWYRIFAGDFPGEEESLGVIRGLIRKRLLPSFPGSPPKPP